MNKQRVLNLMTTPHLAFNTLLSSPPLPQVSGLGRTPWTKC